jgi:hypothetical protein
MVGVRLGERFLQAGVSDPRVFALIAGKAGLTGSACAVVDSAAAAAVLEEAAAHEGVLVEVSVATGGAWPYAPASFDVGVIDGDVLLAAGAEARSSRLRDMGRAVRPGGRVLAVSRWAVSIAGRLGFARERTGPSPAASALVNALQEAGFRPVRLLAEREGLTFVEGFRQAS